MTCDSALEHSTAFLEGSLAGPDRELLLRHLESCADCRALFTALEAPADPGLAEAIVARTTGGACDRARSLLCDRVDGALPSFDAELVDGHLRHCVECAAMARALEALREDLPGLATIDPGPGFLEAVLSRTSRRPRRPTLGERWSEVVAALLGRPRVALEGAFVAAALVAVLMTAVDRPLPVGPIRALNDVPVAVNEIEASLRVGARSAWISAEVLVVDHSTAAWDSIRSRYGTLKGSGASGESGRREVAREKQR